MSDVWTTSRRSPRPSESWGVRCVVERRRSRTARLRDLHGARASSNRRLVHRDSARQRASCGSRVAIERRMFAGGRALHREFDAIAVWIQHDALVVAVPGMARAVEGWVAVGPRWFRNRSRRTGSSVRDRWSRARCARSAWRAQHSSLDRPSIRARSARVRDPINAGLS